MNKCIATIVMISILCASTPAEAMTVDDIVAIPPVSQHYVQRVLDRSNAGIARAATLTTPGGWIYDTFKPWWIYYATSAMLSTVDTRVQVTASQQDLLATTPCLHLDIIILQSKIEKVRDELHQALENGEPGRVMLLQNVIRFLNHRIAHLLRGATDPLYEDTDWSRREIFDPVTPTWCCPGGIPSNTCIYGDESVCISDGGIPFSTPRGCQEYGCLLPASQSDLDGKLCPFASDYLPPVISGYGCDATAFPSAALGHTPSAEELSALASLIQKRDAFITRVQAFAPLVQEIDAMAGASASSYGNLGSGLTRTHKEVHGCLESIPIAQQIGASSLLQQLHATAYEGRGPFSIPRDEPWIAVRFAKVVREWGDRRPQAKALRYPSEFPPGPDRAAAEQREQKKSQIERARDWFLREFFASWNQDHGRREAPPIAKSQDSALQIADASPGIGSAVYRLGALVRTHSSGLRFFTKGFAYYLRRSCIYRSCNQKLDQVLRIIFENSCFPYFSGNYYGDPQGYLKCKNDAKVTVSP